MSDPFKNPNRFRELLREAAHVTVVDDTGKVLRKQTVDNQDIDELLWAVDKYSWDPITKKGKLNIASQESIRTVAEQLISPSQIDRLIEVVTPWRQMGFDALRRILAAQDQSNRPFPFFQTKIPTPANSSKNTLGATISWPTNPTPKCVDDIYNMSSYSRGRGELLLCLMTGGIRSGSGGDFLDPQGQMWEVKQPEGKQNLARLGEATSSNFKDILNKNKNITNDQALTAALNASGIAGFLFVSGKNVVAYSVQAAKFHALNSQGRVEIVIHS